MKVLKRLKILALSFPLLMITSQKQRHHKIISLLDTYSIEDVFRVVAMMDGFFDHLLYGVVSSTINLAAKSTGVDERWKL